MSPVTYPDPSFQYQGAALTLAGLRLGPIPVGPVRSYGTNYAARTGAKIPDITIRPTEQPVTDPDPCTTSFVVFYTQYRSDPGRGVTYPMVFRLTSDLDGGVIGVEASLEVESNYPEIKMSIPRFPFTQPGFGILKEETLPGDYQAVLTVRVWNGDADVALDGWLMLECGYHREDAGSPEGSELVAVGRTSLFPVSSAASRVASGPVSRR